MAITQTTEQENATKPAELNIPEPENSGVLTSQDANDFVAENQNNLAGQVSEIQSFLNTSGKYTNLGGGQYIAGKPTGSNGQASASDFTFNVQDLEADPNAKGYIEGVKGGADTTQGLGMAVSRGASVNAVDEKYKTQREALVESQKQAKASTQASEFRSGRTGAGLAEESITAKTDQALARQRKDFQDAVQKNIDTALNELQAGNIRSFTEQQKMIASAKQDYLDELEQTQDIATKMQTYEEKAIKIGEDRRTSASKVIGDYAKAGTEITDSQFEIIAGTYGIDTEDARNIYNIAQVESSIALDKAGQAFAKGEQDYAKGEQDYAKGELDIVSKQEEIITKRRESMEKYLDLADKVGAAVPITIGDNTYTYQGYDESGYQTAFEKNNITGEMFFNRVNKKTGEVDTTSVGFFGQEGWDIKEGKTGLFRVNKNTGETVRMTPSQGQVDAKKTIPAGSVSPFGANRTQCGAFVNDCTGAGLADTYESKMAKTDPYIKAGSDNPPQYGDFFVQKLGTWTGHTGMVLDYYEEDGKQYVETMESNYPTKGKIGYRTVPVEQIQGFGRTGQIHPILQNGTDAQAETPMDSLAGEFGTQTMENDELLTVAEAEKLGVAYGTKRSGAFGKMPKPTETDTTAQADSLRKEFTGLAEVKEFKTVRDSYAQIKSVAKDDSAAGDLSLIFSYMKLLDPNSVVRETEFANAQNAAGVPDKVQNIWNRARNGERLTGDQRKDFIGKAETIYDSRYKQIKPTITQYEDLAKKRKLDPKDVIFDIQFTGEDNVSTGTIQTLKDGSQLKWDGKQWNEIGTPSKAMIF